MRALNKISFLPALRSLVLSSFHFVLSLSFNIFLYGPFTPFIIILIKRSSDMKLQRSEVNVRISCKHEYRNYNEGRKGKYIVFMIISKIFQGIITSFALLFYVKENNERVMY